MFTVSFIKTLLSIINSLVDYAKTKKLMDAGAALSILEGLKDVQSKVIIARDAIANVDKLPIDKDPANRDNQ